MPPQAATLSPEQLKALLDEPALSPPPGEVPNYVNPPNLNTLVMLTLGLSLSLSTLAVSMRIYTKRFLIRSLDYEDYAIILGWICQIGEAIPSRLTIRDGGGYHQWDIKLKTFSKLLYDVNVTSITYDVTVFFIKLSILLQYIRIFVPSRKGNMSMFVGVHICIWSNFMFYVLNMAFLIGLCSPRRKIWQPWLKDGHCYSYADWFMASGVFNVISDFAILVLPMPCLWRLQMPRRKKLVTMGIFATGSLACITSILRTYYSWKVLKEPDISYNLTKMGLWVFAEIAIGIIVACLPVLPKFFRHVGQEMQRAVSITFRSGSSSGSSPGSGDCMKKIKSKEKFRKPSTNHSERVIAVDQWEDASFPKAQLDGKYIALADYGHESGNTQSRNPTRRQDLEMAVETPPALHHCVI